MGSLYFMGIRKSSIKKILPFKYFFDWRDKRVYRRILQQLDGRIENISPAESMLKYSLNGRELKLLFRKFPCSDLGVLEQVFISACYEPIVKKMLSIFPPDANLKIIDAGANVGYSCMYFMSNFPSAQVIAIEPEEKNQQQLEKNMMLNGIHLKELLKGALWPRSAFLEVKRNFRDNREAAFTVEESKSNKGIPGFSLKQILENHGWDEVDFIKMDIEGGERFLFATEEKADALLQKTKFLAIEIHDEFNIRNTIYHHLARNGFEYFEYGDLTMGVNTRKIQA
jgi:FkbM family methyltransferase